jgi:hypothetical protein
MGQKSDGNVCRNSEEPFEEGDGFMGKLALNMIAARVRFLIVLGNTEKSA